MLHALPEAATSFPLFEPEEDRKGRQNLPGLQRIRQNYTKGISKMQWTNKTAESGQRIRSAMKSQLIFTLCETKVINGVALFLQSRHGRPAWNGQPLRLKSLRPPKGRKSRGFKSENVQEDFLKKTQMERKDEKNPHQKVKNGRKTDRSAKERRKGRNFRGQADWNVNRPFWWWIDLALEEFNFHFNNRLIIFRPLSWTLKERKLGALIFLIRLFEARTKQEKDQQTFWRRWNPNFQFWSSDWPRAIP